MFTNLYKIDKIKCKLIIIHGKSDEVIPHTHSQLLLQRYKNSGFTDPENVLGLFIEGIKHNEIKYLLQVK